ncbi:EF-hand calcium-binding domain-containing protein 6 [Lingula anatina]|uniref:EF-hand calcium-binding domain-containing protein 6 n=2 Tax=Lingula anatina TaxID=7574 RepID=A0A2R2MIB5_LINAN|nr:EF-hand calcium-binding domain-containing protein 6 [Lingula anatina]XP_023929940.1 EF-hand calcium-binding domain-containing protein 6 [Lingula anatina]|eukprot:XP_023929939.1 EF-hand calcium-binding domain-containing protein 6 [Lingula anatina]
MAASAVMPGLRPATQGATFTERPALPLRTGTQLKVIPQGRHALEQQKPDVQTVGTQGNNSATSAMTNANPSLSVIEVESLLREKVKTKYDALHQAFQNYDIDQSLAVTKGEFRRVLESFCFPLTTEQFNGIIAKVELSRNGTVKYCDFLDKFHGHEPMKSEKWISGTHKYMQTQGPKEHMNIDQLEKMLRDKLVPNVRNIVKSFHLFDYNRDGKVQRHDLRKVLENYCFKITDQQFDKLWQRYDYHHSGLVDYIDFLRRLGVRVENTTTKPQEPQGTKGAMVWDQAPLKPKLEEYRRKIFEDRDNALKGLNFDQIEIEFRKKMRSNYGNLKRAFLAFDAEKNGFVDLEDLKSILISFTVPMSDQLFQQLMERCLVKASGKIQWEWFLDKFQDPQGSGNGQTVPMRVNHKYFPIRETEETMDADGILSLLRNKIENGYSSFKNAFLQIDQNRDGRITRKEFKKIIKNFKIKLSNDEFQLMCDRLDPNKTNYISYLKFLQLFEPRETKEGHKWLNSVHRFNNHPRPTILAWETVEEILRDKATDNWRPISVALVAYDERGDGMIQDGQLRRILDKFCLPVSEEHFANMLSRCESHANDKVNYVEFMIRLGVDVKPGDVVGLSTQITEGSKQEELRRATDLQERQALENKANLDRTNAMTPEEVIVRLKDRMAQHNQEIRRSFLSFDKKGKGKISKKSFREVLSSFGMVMSDECFKNLTEKLGFYKGHLSYTDFVMAFEDPRIGDASPGNVHQPNHRVNPIRGDEVGMTAEQVEAKFLGKLKENFADLRGAFYKFDDDHNGLLTKANFRRLLDAFMFIMPDKEFERLCQRLGFTKQTKLSYRDFLDAFEIRDTPEGHKWLNSDHRFNDTYYPELLQADTVHDILAQKVHAQWKDLSTAFCSMDKNGNGIITKKELRSTLARFILHMDKEEFKKLWARYDSEGKGYVTHQDFLQKLGAAEFAPGDMGGTSRKIVDNSYKALDLHHQQQQAKHERITQHQAERTAVMSVNEVERELRDRFRDQYDNMYAAFKKYDTKKKGSLSVSEIQKVLVDLNYFLNDDQFYQLLDKIGLVATNSRINYEQFLKAFEDGRKSSYGHRTDVQLEEYEDLNPTSAEKKIRDKISNNFEVLISAFTAFDKDKTGVIGTADFRRVLDNFCFKMTDAQYRHLMSRMSAQGDNTVSYPDFMDYFKQDTQQESEQWLETLQRNMMRGRTPQQSVGMEEIHAALRENVTTHFYQMARAFAEIDYAKIGVVSKEDFRNVLNRNSFRLSNDQFENLWDTLKINEFGNLEYRDFLKRYSNSTSPRPPSRSRSELGASPGGRRSETPLSLRSGSVARSELMGTPAGSRAGSRVGSRQSGQGGGHYTPLVNAEHIENKLRDHIHRTWKDIQRLCRLCDQENTGTVEMQDIKDIFDKLGVEMAPYEFDQLMIKYDLKENGRFSYVHFLRHFVLSRAADKGFGRKKLQEPKVQVSTGEGSPFFFEAMQRLQSSVVSEWKEMRRAFRMMDKPGLGIVTPAQFRQVLREFNLNLSENEFYHLMTYYDKDLKGKISYNDFIGAFLRAS